MLTQTVVQAAFHELSGELDRRGILGELSVVDNTIMVLAFNARNATKDLDAILEPSSDVRVAAGVVAEKLALPTDWLNDSAKGYLSPSGEYQPVETIDLPNLRVQAPTPEYMLAMKVLAARAAVGSDRGDAGDIAHLIRLLGLRDSKAVMDIVTRFYEPSRLLPRSLYLVDEIFEEIQS